MIANSFVVLSILLFLPILLGGAGTGKSFLLARIQTELEAKGVNVAMTAATGIHLLSIPMFVYHYPNNSYLLQYYA